MYHNCILQEDKGVFMKYRIIKLLCSITFSMILFSNINISAYAINEGINAYLPSGGVNLTLSKGPSLGSLKGDKKYPEIEDVVEISSIEELRVAKAAALAEIEQKEFESLVIAQVDYYVNVRSIPSEDGEVVGKLYDNSVGTFLTEEDGWYQIQSGAVTGYVKAEYCVTGKEAVDLAKEVGTRIAVVNTTTLFVRDEASTESNVIGMVPEEEELIVTEEIDGWVKVSIEEGEGYVSTDYVSLRTEFVEAESKEEEEARLAKEKQERERAQAAARAKNTEVTTPQTQNTTITSDGSMGAAVAEYALQFVGNPYVYGGTSLTEGADCSGFVLSVYANFGVSLPHSSTADRSQGYAVDGLENAIPGDLICYSGHVGIYIGDGQIVHASTSKTGIIVGKADYRKILAIRRIF